MSILHRSVLVLGFACLAPVPGQCRPAWIVQDPQQIRFVSLKEPFLHVRSLVEGRVGLVDHARRLAMGRQSAAWGIPPAHKKELSIGCVARTDDQGRLSYVLALKGEIEPAKIRERLVKIHRDSRRRRQVEPDVEEIEVGGHPATRIGYGNRPASSVLVPLDGLMLVAGAPTGDTSLVEETLAALAGSDETGRGEPEPFRLAVHTALTDPERQQVREFQKRRQGARAKQLRERFRRLHDAIRPGGAQEDDLKSLEERLNEQYLRSSAYDVSLDYQPGAAADSDVYVLAYALQFDTPEEAATMRELILEQELFFRENAPHEGVDHALDSVTVDAAGDTVTVRLEADTVEKQYDIAAAYMTMTLSMASADRSLGVIRAP